MWLTMLVPSIESNWSRCVVWVVIVSECEYDTPLFGFAYSVTVWCWWELEFIWKFKTRNRNLEKKIVLNSECRANFSIFFFFYYNLHTICFFLRVPNLLRNNGKFATTKIENKNYILVWKKKWVARQADVEWVNETARGPFHICVWQIWKWFVFSFFLLFFFLFGLLNTKQPIGFKMNEPLKWKSGKQPFIFVIILVEFERRVLVMSKIKSFCPVWWWGVFIIFVRVFD